jgi:hypothetical protein
MKKYMFRTTATMKEYNNRHWYITPDIIRTKYINAENMREALEEYARNVSGKDYIDISKTAIRNKRPMYIDTPEGPQQIGYVITGKTEMQREDGSWSTQYIDLWIDVDIISPADFEEEAI